MPHTAIKMLAVAACLSIASGAHAATVYKTTLAGANENPANASPGTGQATLTFDTAAHTMTLSVTFQGLTAPTTAAHIHCCAAPPNNVGVATMPPSFVGFPAGVVSGSYMNVFDLTQLSSYNAPFVAGSGGTAASAEAALLAGLNAGQAYFNLHTTAFPGGEIRGHFAVVPEPGTWALMITGFGFVGAAARRRRASLLGRAAV